MAVTASGGALNVAFRSGSARHPQRSPAHPYPAAHIVIVPNRYRSSVTVSAVSASARCRRRRPCVELVERVAPARVEQPAVQSGKRGEGGVRGAAPSRRERRDDDAIGQLTPAAHGRVRVREQGR